MKKLKSLEKRSFLLGTGFGVVLLTSLISIVLVSNILQPPPPTKEVEQSQESLGKLVDHCFERYNTGIEWSLYSNEAEIETLFPNPERELVTKDQLICSLKALNFSEPEGEALFTDESGRLDNSDFQVKWEAAPTCGDGQDLFCKKGTQNWEIRKLTINLKDFRP